MALCDQISLGRSEGGTVKRLIDAGYRMLRFTSSDVFDTPVLTVALVRRARQPTSR